MFSAAERSVSGQRIRNFDADEVAAFAAAFELPVAFFYLPPRRVQEVGDIDEVAPEAASESLSRDEMVKLATDDIAARVAELRKR